MTNGLSCAHVSLPTPCYHGDTSQPKPRDQEISMKDNLTDTGAGGLSIRQEDPSIHQRLRGKVVRRTEDEGTNRWPLSLKLEAPFLSTGTCVIRIHVATTCQSSIFFSMSISCSPFDFTCKPGSPLRWAAGYVLKTPNIEAECLEDLVTRKFLDFVGK